jgi:hypothetical protein
MIGVQHRSKLYDGPIGGRDSRHHKAREVLDWVEGRYLLSWLVGVEHADGDEAVVEVGEHQYLRILFHGLVHLNDRFDDGLVVIWAVEVDLPLRLEERVCLEVEAGDDTLKTLVMLIEDLLW